MRVQAFYVYATIPSTLKISRPPASVIKTQLAPTPFLPRLQNLDNSQETVPRTIMTKWIFFVPSPPFCSVVQWFIHSSTKWKIPGLILETNPVGVGSGRLCSKSQTCNALCCGESSRVSLIPALLVFCLTVVELLPIHVINHIIDFITLSSSDCASPASQAVLAGPPGVCKGMEQRGNAGGEAESPGRQDSASPEERGEKGESPTSSGPSQCKLSRLEVNGSPTNPRSRQNCTPLRPLGGVCLF